MIQSLSINNMITECRGIQNRIILESILSNPTYLTTLVKAMRDDQIIELTYRRYTDDDCWNVCVEPYCIKLHQRRWYLLGRTVNKGELRVFGLDRVQAVKATDCKFKLGRDVTPDDYFSECFGVIRDERKAAERIILRAYGMQRYYMRDLPLHSSQRLLTSDADSTDFELTLRPTADFTAHILSCGPWLEVVSPPHLADHVRRMAIETAARYSKE